MAEIEKFLCSDNDEECNNEHDHKLQQAEGSDQVRLCQNDTGSTTNEVDPLHIPENELQIKTEVESENEESYINEVLFPAIHGDNRKEGCSDKSEEECTSEGDHTQISKVEEERTKQYKEPLKTVDGVKIPIVVLEKVEKDKLVSLVNVSNKPHTSQKKVAPASSKNASHKVTISNPSLIKTRYSHRILKRLSERKPTKRNPKNKVNQSIIKKCAVKKQKVNKKSVAAAKLQSTKISKVGKLSDSNKKKSVAASKHNATNSYSNVKKNQKLNSANRKKNVETQGNYLSRTRPTNRNHKLVGKSLKVNKSSVKSGKSVSSHDQTLLQVNKNNEGETITFMQSDFMEVEVSTSETVSGNKSETRTFSSGGSKKSVKSEFSVTKNKMDKSASRKNGITQKNFPQKKTAKVSPRTNQKIIGQEPSSFSSKGNATVKDKVLTGLEEPLYLISKLTGIQVPPSKIEVLPFSCVSRKVKNNDNKKDTPTNLKITIIEEGDNSESPNVSTKQISHCSPINKTESVTKEGQISKSKSDSCTEVVKPGRVRTLYDVINDVFILLPSWNLHILPDTNTFCIGQITRNGLGVPQLAKCIELDDNYNAKVFIFQQHCKKFDGIYDSEEKVIALINQVDNYPKRIL